MNNNRRNKKYRIKSKFRFITFLVLVVGLAVGLFGYFNGSGISIAKTDPAKTLSVEVADGNTVWDIAYEYKSSDKEIRKAVYEICQANELEDGNIEEGMILSIPQTL